MGTAAYKTKPGKKNMVEYWAKVNNPAAIDTRTTTKVWLCDSLKLGGKRGETESILWPPSPIPISSHPLSSLPCLSEVFPPPQTLSKLILPSNSLLIISSSIVLILARLLIQFSSLLPTSLPLPPPTQTYTILLQHLLPAVSNLY